MTRPRRNGFITLTSTKQYTTGTQGSGSKIIMSTTITERKDLQLGNSFSEKEESGQSEGSEKSGKESLYIEDNRDSKSFQKTFCKVQQLAKKMAKRFNKRLLALPCVDEKTTPIIKFLDCHVMILSKYQSETKFLLVEKMLDHTKYKRWNTNAGHVNNKTSPAIEASRFSDSADCPFTIDEIPQAFSHFTYIDSGRKFLICDLQGVLNTHTAPPVFELTDPAIHYAEMTDRQDFGRTDRGQQGIDDFLRSYKSQQLSDMLFHNTIKNPFDRDLLDYDDVMPPQIPCSPKLGSILKSTHESVRHEETKKSVRFV